MALAGAPTAAGDVLPVQWGWLPLWKSSRVAATVGADSGRLCWRPLRAESSRRRPRGERINSGRYATESKTRRRVWKPLSRRAAAAAFFGASPPVPPPNGLGGRTASNGDASHHHLIYALVHAKVKPRDQGATMRSVIVALALSSATALGRRRRRASTKLSAATKDPATTSYQPTEGANAAVDTNNKGDAWVSQMQRPRRNRKSAGVRSMVRENFLTPANLMQPIFIHEDSDQVVPIPSMPGQSRHTLDSMVEQVKKGMALGVKSFILFPKVPDDLKTNFADECYNPDGIVPRAVAMCKAACPEATICTDIA